MKKKPKTEYQKWVSIMRKLQNKLDKEKNLIRVYLENER